MLMTSDIEGIRIAELGSDRAVAFAYPTLGADDMTDMGLIEIPYLIVNRGEDRVYGSEGHPSRNPIDDGYTTAERFRALMELGQRAGMLRLFHVNAVVNHGEQ